jgi:hypothetical protein
MAFWTEVTSETNDPKRQFRFTLQVPGLVENYVWFVKKTNKPSLTISETPHKYLNHTFYYPGKVEWNTVTVTLVDPVSPDAAAGVSKLLEAGGYKVPTDSSALSTISKAGSVVALGDVIIDQIDASGTRSLETWTLKNAWIKDIKYGELDYDGDDHTVIDVEFRYDWAVLETTESKHFSTEAG